MSGGPPVVVGRAAFDPGLDHGAALVEADEVQLAPWAGAALAVLVPGLAEPLAGLAEPDLREAFDVDAPFDVEFDDLQAGTGAEVGAEAAVSAGEFPGPDLTEDPPTQHAWVGLEGGPGRTSR